MTCTFPNKLACDRLVCRIDGCRDYWRLNLTKTERLLEQRLGLNAGSKRDYIGQLVRKPKNTKHCDYPESAKKDSISDEAMEALADIFQVPVAYLFLETADHGLPEKKPQPTNLKRVVTLKREIAEIIDPQISYYRDGDQHASRERSAREDLVSPYTGMHDRHGEEYHEPVFYDDDDEELQKYDELMRSIVEQPRGLDEMTPVEQLVSNGSNPLSHAALQWRSRNPASRKSAVFATRLVDGEWRVSVADLAPDQRPLFKTGADDKLYALMHPADRPIPWIPAGASLLFDASDSLCRGDWIITLQPTDQQIDAMFSSPETIHGGANREMKPKPIWSEIEERDPAAPREFRLGVWQYVSQHYELNTMRVVPGDDPTGDEHIICYDQIWLAPLKGFIR
jgi:hypothetical protein